MQFCRWMTILLLAISLTPVPEARAEKRVALVVGNTSSCCIVDSRTGAFPR